MKFIPLSFFDKIWYNYYYKKKDVEFSITNKEISQITPKCCSLQFRKIFIRSSLMGKNCEKIQLKMNKTNQ